MTAAELTKAVELSLPGIGEILDLPGLQMNCATLVSFSNSGTAQFIHRTLRQFICSENCSNQLVIRPRHMHIDITRVCLSYLLGKTFTKSLSTGSFQAIDKTHLRNQYPLLSYAALYWPEHVNSARIEDHRELLELLSSFLCSRNILTTIEAALTIGGIDSLQSWLVALLELSRRLTDELHSDIVARFIIDLRQLIRLYGDVLNSFPSQIFYLINERFPLKSHFWKYFGRKEIFLASGQCDEWDPLIATLNNSHVNCIAISSNGCLAVGDKAGISILKLQSYIELGRLPIPDVTVLAIAFSDDGETLVTLCQDGTLKLISITSWQITRDITRIVDLPAVVREWHEDRFWESDFSRFDHVQVNLSFVGRGIMAGNILIDPESQKRKVAMQDLSLTSSTTTFASTKAGDMIGFSPDGELRGRRLGILSESVLSAAVVQASMRRILALSDTGRLAATCAVILDGECTISQNIFECMNLNTKISILTDNFGKDYRITAASFSNKESLLAANAYNAKRLLDTTKIWRVEDEPQLIWETTMFFEYTTCIAFGLDDTIFVKAGRFLRIWDVQFLCRAAPHETHFGLSLGLKMSRDGKKIASLTGEHLSTENPTLHLWCPDQLKKPTDITWPQHLHQRNVNLSDPLAFSADAEFIAWDYVIISSITKTIIDRMPLNDAEKICQVGGFNSDSSIVIYGIEGKANLLNWSVEESSSHTPLSSRPAQDVVKYSRTTGERETIFSTAISSLLRTHPTQALVGILAGAPDQEKMASIYNLDARQFIARIPIRESSPSAPISPEFEFFLSDASVVPFRQTVDHDYCTTARAPDIRGDLAVAIDNLDSRASEADSLHSRHLLPSGRIIYFLNDGWVTLWDKDVDVSRVKYLAPLNKSPISTGHTAVMELDTFIRVVVQDISNGLLCFDIHPKDLFGSAALLAHPADNQCR